LNLYEYRSFKVGKWLFSAKVTMKVPEEAVGE
jgi:hypothetical protein